MVQYHLKNDRQARSKVSLLVSNKRTDENLDLYMLLEHHVSYAYFYIF